MNWTWDALWAFPFALGLLVIVHEYGHYRVAVACGVKVLRFSVGFGRVLWRRQATPDSTEFVVCALPLGGYVRMLDEREDQVPAADRHRAFNRKTLWQRSAIIVAGPLANLLLAVLLYAAAHWIGLDEPKAVLGTPIAATPAERSGLKAGDWVRALATEGEDWRDVHSLVDLRWQLMQAALARQAVRLQVSDADGRGSRTLTLDLRQVEARDIDTNLAARIGIGGALSEPVLRDVQAGGPGDKAGLRRGDRVLSIDGKPVADAQTVYERVRAAVRNGQPQPLDWVIEREGRTVPLVVTPRVVQETNGSFGRIDVAPGQPPAMVKVRYGFIDGLQLGFVRTGEVSALTLKLLGRMLTGQASLKNLSGPLTIAEGAGQSARAGGSVFINFLALVSVSLGVLNLLPLPLLDGGHLMVYIFEGATGRAVSDQWLARLQRGGIVVLLMMMSVAIFNDVARQLGFY